MELEDNWTKFYTKADGIMYPSEAVIRIFKGEYPGLKMPKPNARYGISDAILDIGCGDGRHFPLFHDLGMECFGTEINDEICDKVMGNIPYALVRPGHASSIPWPDETFDYVLSWNSCYYMTLGGKLFEPRVYEMNRVLCDGGWLVCSVPTERCFIFEDSEPCGDDCVVIKKDHFGLRNGEVMRLFRGQADIEDEFGFYFEEFCHSTIDIDCFGLPYSWYVFAARKKAIDQL